MQLLVNVGQIEGFPPEEQARFQKLLQVYDGKSAKNAEKDRY